MMLDADTIDRVAKEWHERECVETNANPKMIPVDPSASIWMDNAGNPLPPWADKVEDIKSVLAELARADLVVVPTSLTQAMRDALEPGVEADYHQGIWNAVLAAASTGPSKAPTKEGI